MKKMKFFSVGPAELYPGCQQHYINAFELQLGSFSHRSSIFRKVYQHTDEQLRQLLNIPATHRIYFTSSASEIWERTILNVVKEKSFHFIQGAFSQKFYDYAQQVGRKPECKKVTDGQGFDDIQNTIITEDIELICTTQNETSSGIRMEESQLQDLYRKHPNALHATDIVSAVPYVQIDFNTMDMAFFSVQKGMGMPPGLGVWIVNERALDKARSLENLPICRGAHFTLSAFEKNYQQFETPSTPNVMAIYVLGKIAEDMNKVGIDKIREQTNQKFEMLHSFINQHEMFEFTTHQKQHLSRTVCVANSHIPSSSVIEYLKTFQIQIGSGYGRFKDKQIRIANFPSSTLEEMEFLIDKLKTITP